MGTLAKPIGVVTVCWKTKFKASKMNWWGQLSFLFICTLLPIDGCWSQSNSGAQNRQGTAASVDPNTSHVLTMGITIGGQPAGVVEIELFGRVVPKTAQNFYQLCDRNAVTARSTDASLSGAYVGAPFHRVIPNFMIQGGDFTRGDGRGVNLSMGISSKMKTFSSPTQVLEFSPWLILEKILTDPNFSSPLPKQLGWTESMLFSAKFRGEWMW